MSDPKMKFLVVDDFSTMRRIVRNLLKELGFTNVDEAEDGVIALQKLKASEFDFVVTDWNMPNMTGIEFLNNLRAQGNQTTFGFVTSESNPAMKEQAIAGGAAFLLTKPFDAERLAEVVGAVVSG